MCRPLASRCSKFRFQPIAEAAHKRKLDEICAAEKVLSCTGSSPRACALLRDPKIRQTRNSARSNQSMRRFKRKSSMFRVSCSFADLQQVATLCTTLKTSSVNIAESNPISLGSKILCSKFDWRCLSALGGCIGGQQVAVEPGALECLMEVRL